MLHLCYRIEYSPAEWETSACVVMRSCYRCINYLLFIGCSCSGKCRKPGTVWEDKDTCTKYRCKQENVGTSKVIMHVIEIPGKHSTNCDT